MKGRGGAARARRRSVSLLFLLAVVHTAPLAAAAQDRPERPRRYWGGGGWRPNPEREGLPLAANGVTDRRFTFCRLLYQHVRHERQGHGWNTDYPGSDWNFMERLEELTTTPTAKWEDGWPGFAVVRPEQDELFECPFLFMSDVGTVGFDEYEASRLRDYLLKGGFLYVDDFWGPWAWEAWAQTMRQGVSSVSSTRCRSSAPTMLSKAPALIAL